ncbi:MAG TPA: MBL fold metallo-hydrolase [Thermomicrobiales bacterium]|jgi:glyoxylase-like metal-dependent hydrolase (beta-lactamase superfamily II)
MDETSADEVRLVPNGDWDPRLLICRCGPTVDSFIVLTTRYVIVIDTLLNPATAAGLLAIARPHLRDGRTPLVINTHADWDHCWGNQLFAGLDAVLPGPIIATERCAARFGAEMDRKLAQLRATEPDRFDQVRPTAPTIQFEERLVIDGGDLTLELFLAPGHTDDHIAIFVPELATLLAGDAAEYPFPFATTVESLPQLRSTLRMLTELQPEQVLYCHASERSGPALLQANIDYFDRLEAVCRGALGRCISMDVSDDDLERRLGWTFAQVIGNEQEAQTLPEMYLHGHRTHLRLMIQWAQDNSK